MILARLRDATMLARPNPHTCPAHMHVQNLCTPSMQDVKARSRRLTELVDSFTDAYAGEVGTIQRVCVVDRAAKAGHLVAHNACYTQVLLPDEPGLLGSVVDVRITAAARWSVFGEVVFWVHQCREPAAAVEQAAALKARARVTTVSPHSRDVERSGASSISGGSDGGSAASAASGASTSPTTTAPPPRSGDFSGYWLRQLQRGAQGWGLEGADLLLCAALGIGVVGMSAAGVMHLRAGARP